MAATLIIDNPGKLREMLGNLECALNLSGYDVTLVYDQRDYVIEARKDDWRLL